MEPLVTSHLYRGTLQDQFFMQGTMDHTSYLCAQPALAFYTKQGGRAKLVAYTGPVREYITTTSLNISFLMVYIFADSGLGSADAVSLAVQLRAAGA